MLVIGSMLMLTVPLRRLSRRHGLTLSDRGLGIASVVWGFVGRRHQRGRHHPAVAADGGGPAGAAVIATDAAISVVIGIVEDRGVRRVSAR